MTISGKVCKELWQELAEVRVIDGDIYMFVEVRVGGEMIIRFPLKLGSDINEITLRTQNILNQVNMHNQVLKVILTETS